MNRKKLEKKGYRLFEINDIDAYIAYGKPQLAYRSVLAITWSRRKSRLCESLCRQTGIAWYEVDDVEEAMSEEEKKDKSIQFIYREAKRFADYLAELEADDFAKLKTIAERMPLTGESFTLLKTKLGINLVLKRRKNIWYVEFDKKKYPDLSIA